MNPILVALDHDDLDVAMSTARATMAHVGGFKVGLELLMSEGPDAVSVVAELGLPVFADVKLHDIPTTVRRAAARLARRGARWVTVHAVGGPEMVSAAVEGLSSEGGAGVLAVTVLTSLDESDFAVIGMVGPIGDRAVALAGLAADAGAEGVVCSPREVPSIARAHPALIKVTPGIRPGPAGAHDQKRVATPEAALAAGADRLVIGRPITGAPDPGEAARAIAEAMRTNA